MHADDISDFLRRIKDAEELGLTAAEVWRTPIKLRFTYPDGQVREETVTPDVAADFFAGMAEGYEVHEIKREESRLDLEEPDDTGIDPCRCGQHGEQRTDLERCARCKRETAPENGYKTGAGFFCSVCASEYDDGVK